MPAALPAKPHFDRVENALVTAAGYRRLAEIASSEETRRHMLSRALTWEKRARRFEQQELPGVAVRTRGPDPNPCRRLYGPGPKGARCAGCAFLATHTPGNHTFHKCELRTFSRSARTDHRMRWLACAKYQPHEG